MCVKDTEMRRILVPAAILLSLSSATAWAYREVECRLVTEGEPCQWVYKDDPFPPAIKPKAKPTQSRKRPVKHRTPVYTRKPIPKVPTPAKVVQPTPEPAPPPPTAQKHSNPDSLIPYHRNMDAALEEIRQIKTDSANTQGIEEGTASDSGKTPVLSGYVVEKQTAPRIVQVIELQTPLLQRKCPKQFLSRFRRHREKLTPEHSWLTQLSIQEAAQLSEAVAGIIKAEVPAENAIISLYDPPYKQTGSAFHSALVYILRASGYSVAGQDFVLQDVHPVRYRITKLPDDRLLVRVKVDNTEATRAYRRTASGLLIAITRVSAIQREAH